MEIYQLRSFVTVAEEGNLTRASERLFTSQPSVSAHIKSLEEELGIILFNRSPKGMQLTEEGHVLMQKAEEILTGVNDLLYQAKGLCGEIVGKIKIGLNSNPAILKITEIFCIMMKKYPRLELHLLQSLASRVLRYVKNECLDAGFYLGENPYPEIQSLRLSSVNMVVTGPISVKDKLYNAGLKEIYRFPWVWRTSCFPFYRMKNSIFTESCFKDSKVIIAEDDETMKTLIIGGAGLGLMEEREALDGERSGKMAIWPGGKIETNLSFVYLRKREKERTIQAMIKVLQDVWETDLMA